MRFSFTPEQEEFRSSLRRALEARSPTKEVRRLMATDQGFERDGWKKLNQELGLTAIHIPEAYGGGGFGQADLAIVLEEMGRGLLCAPFLSTVLAEAGNRTEETRDPTAHAEMLAIRAAAARLGAPRLVDCDLYVTLEPCPMCAQAISFARIRRLYWGAADPKGGGVEHGPRIFDQPTCHHKPVLYPGLSEGEAGELLRAFFRARR